MSQKTGSVGFTMKQTEDQKGIQIENLQFTCANQRNLEDTVESGRPGTALAAAEQNLNLKHPAKKRLPSAGSHNKKKSRPSSAHSNVSGAVGKSRSTTTKTGQSQKPRKQLTIAQKQLAEIEDTFKALRHLPKQRLHPFDFPPEELEKMKVLFPEHKPIPVGMPKNMASKNQGITIFQLMRELKARINLDEKAFLTMVGQLDRKNDNKVTWTEFLNFLTNEGVRRETVNDANLYGYGVKRLAYKGRHNLRIIDQYNGPEKLAEYYIDGMILIKLKNARLLLNLFENKEAKLFDLRTKMPVQHLVFSSDYSKPKLKKQDIAMNRRKTIVGVDQISKAINSNVASIVRLVEPSVQSELGDSTSMASLQHMTSGVPHSGHAINVDTLEETPALTNSDAVVGNIEQANMSFAAGSVCTDFSSIAKQPQMAGIANRRQTEILRKVGKSQKTLVSMKAKLNAPIAGSALLAVSNFVDQDIDVSEAYQVPGGKHATRRTTPAGNNSRKGEADVASSNNSRKSRAGKMKLQLGVLKEKSMISMGKNTQLTSVVSDFEGSTSTFNQSRAKLTQSTRKEQQRPHTQMLPKNISESDLNEKPESPIRAWRQRESYHRKVLKKTLTAEADRKTQDERDKKNCMILGLADLASKNSARDFIDRANNREKDQKQKSHNPSMRADAEINVRAEMEKARDLFNKKLDGVNKQLKKYDDKRESQFFGAYKMKKEADEAEQHKLGIYQNHDDVHSNSGYRSGKSLSNLGRRRKTIQNSDALETSSRISGARSQTQLQGENHRTQKSKADKSNFDGYINKEIDYFGRSDLIERARQATNYMPLALREYKSLSKLQSAHIEVLRLEETRCQRALKRTRDRKDDCLKDVMRVKEANRYFFTQNPNSPPYYYPEKSHIDERATATTKDSSSPNDTDTNQQVDDSQTPRKIAARDFNMLFGDDIVPIPCDGPRFKKALEERRIKENRTKEDSVREAEAIARKEREQKIARKLKTTKEIYTVAADYCLSPDGLTARVALALIDQQILIYQVKQSGVKVTMVETFSFYVKFPSKAAVSALTLNHYVTDGRPIVCIGSQLGDIAIYYIDHMNPKGIVCQKQIEMFNFFERGSKIEVVSENEENSGTTNILRRSPEDESVMERQTTEPRGKPFIHEFMTGSEKTHITEARIGGNKNLIEEDSMSQSSDKKTVDGIGFGLDVKKQVSMAVKEPSVWIRDDFWNVLTNTRTNIKGRLEEGPNGITLWNCIFPKMITNEESAISLCNSLIAMKLESLDEIYKIVSRWRFWMHEHGDNPKDAIVDFEREMEEIRARWQAQTAEQARKDVQNKRRSSKDLSQSAKQPSKRRTIYSDASAKKNGAPQGVKLKSQNRRGSKASIQLNPISEEDIENVSTYGDGNFVAKREVFPAKDGKKQLDKREASKQTTTQKPTTDKKLKLAPISCIRYVKDIGLLVTTFTGHIKFFDAFNFFTVWKNSNKMRNDNQHTSICTFDVSSPLGIMVTGGAEGLMLAIDPHALGVTNQAEVSKGKDILNVFIFEEQQQIITVCEDRSVTLWDAFRLEKLQLIKDVDKDLHIPKFSSACFDQKEGILYIGDQMLSVWKCAVDPIVEINALQIQTLSETMARERNLQPLMEVSRQFSKQPMRSEDVRNGRVLISDKMSSLVDILCDEAAISDNFFATVDTENLCRFWNISEHRTNITFKIPMQKRVTACDINKECTLIAVGNQIGEAFVANKLSGGIIYRLPGADEEISCIKFLSGQSEFWIVAALWHGKMVFWSQPNEQNNFTINAKMRIGHRGDINTLDCQANYIISGGQDGLLGVWNQFSGVLKYAIKLPDAVDTNMPFAKEKMKNATKNAIAENSNLQATAQASNMIRRTIVDVMFHPYWRNVALVLQEGGNVHAIDVSNGMIVNDFLAMVQMNSHWAIDPYSYHIMVVGDQGKAILLDARMGAADMERKFTNKNRYSEEQPSEEKRVVRSKRVPTYKPQTDSSTKEPLKWRTVKNWFTAHSLSKTEPHFVNNVRFSQAMSIFITSTNFGEVKLWDSQSCQPLGVLNSDAFQPAMVSKYIKRMTTGEGH